MHRYREEDMIVQWGSEATSFGGECFKNVVFYGILISLLCMPTLYYHDYTYCNNLLTKCVIQSVDTVRMNPLPGELIDSFYYDRNYVIFPVDTPDIQYALDCWGKNCGDKLILDT